MVESFRALRAKSAWQGIEQNQRRGRGRVLSWRIEAAKAGGGAEQTAQSTTRGCQSRSRSADGRGAGHGSRRPSGQRRGPADQPADRALVEAEGDQRRGLVAGQPEVLPDLGRQVRELPVGRRLAAARPSIL